MQSARAGRCEDGCNWKRQPHYAVETVRVRRMTGVNRRWGRSRELKFGMDIVICTTVLQGGAQFLHNII